MKTAAAKVLIIDDDPIARRFTALALEALARVEALEAADGLEGLERAQAARPDLILLDAQPTGSRCRETLAGLRADPWTACVPIMLLASHPSARLERLGVVAVLAKDLGPVSQAQAVLDVLARTRTQVVRRPA